MRDFQFNSPFQVLEQMSPKPDQVGSANAKANMKKNRYTNYLPCKSHGCHMTITCRGMCALSRCCLSSLADKHRVVLKAEHPDYIHATFANVS